MMSKPDDLSAHMSYESGFIHARCHTQWSKLIGMSWFGKASGPPVHSKHKTLYMTCNKISSCLERQSILTHIWRQFHKGPTNIFKRG